MTEPVDLRLAIGALVGWAAVLWGLGQSAVHVGVATAATVLIATVLVIAARRWPVLLVAAFAACCMASSPNLPGPASR
jgi:hypothetical protein